MQTYRAALVGCGRMGAWIDNEVAGNKTTVLPYSHAAGYEACDRTELIAGSDMRPEILVKFGERYGVAPEHHYTDYQEMILKEKPDILSIATQPQDRAAVALFAIEHGVKALYVEKPLCASMAEANAIKAAVEKHGVVLNMGTNRRWSTGFEAMKAEIDSGKHGRLSALSINHKATVFNTDSHWVDTLRYLNNDAPALWVQAYMPDGDEAFAGDQVIADPHCEGTIAFANGVTAYLLATDGAPTHHAYCEHAELIVNTGDSRYELWSYHPIDESGADRSLTLLDYTPSSATLRLIEDIVHALDTGEPTRGGIAAAYANTEILFGLLESHQRSGARVALPLVDNDLAFAPNVAPRQPKFTVS